MLRRWSAKYYPRVSKVEMLQRLELLYTLVERHMKLLYKRSLLGIAWTLINPILQLIVFLIVFRGVLSVDVQNYASFVFAGLLAWNWFQSSLFQASGVIISSRALIRQPNFPHAILPMVPVFTGMVHFIIALPVLIFFLLIDNLTLNFISLISLPLIIISQLIFTVSLSYPLAALNVSFRDTQHILGVLLQLMFYMSGVFYRIDNVSGAYRYIYNLNPLVHFINAYRQVLIEGTWPTFIALLIITGISGFLLPIGHKVFRTQSRRFIEEV